MRLQKYMAMCGVASRRGSEKMISEGRVCINGIVVAQMGVQVEEGDVVSVDDKPLKLQRKMRYIMLNKPQGVVTTLSDPEGRATLVRYLEKVDERVYPVGRLDYDTQGLLLLTNDGQLANEIMHPSRQVDKVYAARVSGVITAQIVDRVAVGGIELDDGHISAPTMIRLIEQKARFARIEITVHEGHNRLVRRLLQAVGCPVTHLTRVRLGTLSLGRLPIGEWRELTGKEVSQLKSLSSREV